MRIGRTIIDLDALSNEDLLLVEHEAHRIRKRREQAEDLMARMNTLICDAKQAGFTFIDRDYGNVITGTDLTMFDEQ